MFKRTLESILLEYARFPVIALLGPRQSGKTTLAKSTFKNHVYTSFEDPKTYDMARNTPEQFLKLYENEYGIIIDEFQNIPEILSLIQLEVDEKKRPGYFVLTGSQNFLMNQAISQSLAGRVGILTLLPLSIQEMQISNLLSQSVETVIFNGSYPRIYAENFPPEPLYSSYLQTYIERDVRQLSQIGDLNTFKKFLILCAARVGQLLNYSDIAANCGVSVPTIQRWISILEASYIIFLLPPYFNNFNKRVTSTPKIYFYDTGIVCNLLNIESAQRLSIDRLYGNLFENFIIADLYKQYFNMGKRPPAYFWRDKNGTIEIDCIIEQNRKLHPIEIKSAEKIALDFFSGLKAWNDIAQKASPDIGNSYLIYGGQTSKHLDSISTVSWADTGSLIDRIKEE